MKIALLTDGFYPYVIGGMQKHSYFLAKYFARKEIYVDLFFFKSEEGKAPFTESEKKYITLIELEFPKLDNWIGHYVRESFEYSNRVFEKIQPDLNKYDFIYSQGFTGWQLIKKKNKGLTCPPIGVNFHGIESFQVAPNIKTGLQHFMLRPFIGYILKNCDYVFSLGGKLTPIQQKITNKPIIEIPIGIEKHWLVSADNLNNISAKRQFIFIGRYERRKGIEELNQVLKKMDDDGSFEMHFVGPIPEEKRLKLKHVIYHGKIMDESKMKDIVSQCEVLVCPSYSEGMPTVILEAMASGCSIIASDVGAVSEEVSEENGWLILPGNVNSLQNAMMDAISVSREILTAKRRKSIEVIKNKFLWERTIETTIREINNLPS